MLVKLVVKGFNTFDYKLIVFLNYQYKCLQNSIKKRKFFSIKKLKFEPEGNFGARVLFAEYFLLFLLLPPLLLFLHLHAVFVQPPLILHYLQTVFRLFGWKSDYSYWTVNSCFRNKKMQLFSYMDTTKRKKKRKENRKTWTVLNSKYK